MPDNLERSIILRPDASLGKAAVGSSRVLAEMVSQTISLARKEQAVTAKRFRIGQYEWCEPDYRQILIWGNALSLAPEEVIRRLLEGRGSRKPEWNKPEWNKTEFVSGRMVALHWNFDLLPIDRFEWGDDLAITHMGLFSSRREIASLSLQLPRLTHLYCDGLGLRELDLSNVPRLEYLDCSRNKLTMLNLSAIPELSCLDSGVNPLIKLDLSKVPKLVSLGLEAHKLTELDLSKVPMLKSLVCSAGHLTELDLTKTPMLTELCCLINKITKLKLSQMPLLTELDCWTNELTELDLSKMPMLNYLNCGSNKLTKLDIRSLYYLNELRYDIGAVRLIKRPDQYISAPDGSSTVKIDSAFPPP